MPETVLDRHEAPRVLRQAVEICPDAIIIARVEDSDVFGVVIYVNHAFERLTGCPAAEAIGRAPHFLEESLHDPHQCRRIREALRRGQKFSTQLLIRAETVTHFSANCM